ncbi:MAG TPA: transcriptional regulator [Pirellulaceae bacterium]
MQSPAPASNVSSIPAEIRELETALRSLSAESRSVLEPLVRRVIESSQRRKRVLNLVQEALGQLRLDMKYLMFDLEATRRERDALRSRMEGLDDE